MINMKAVKKYVVATIGAVFVFLGTLAAILFLPTLFIPRLYENMAYVIGLYVIGSILGLLAAISSFWATLRVYSRPKENGHRT